MSRFYVNHEIGILIETSDSLEEYNGRMELLSDMVEINEYLFNFCDSLGYVIFCGIREDYES